MNSIFNYTDEDTYIHRLSGLSKLIAFLALTFTVMLTFDPRVILVVMVLSYVVMRQAKIKFSQIKIILFYVLFFLIVNAFLTFLFDPEYGVRVYNSRTVLFEIAGRYVVTKEQLFYQFTKMSKYASVIPLGIIFLFTTNPSEFAASINRVGVPYKAAYALSLTLRYFPDVQREYITISKAQQAKGLKMGKETSVFHRLKYGILTVFPLIFSTLDRVETISNAMDLRGFSKKRRRTWYRSRPLTKTDIATIVLTLSIFTASILITIFINGSKFYNPF